MLGYYGNFVVGMKKFLFSSVFVLIFCRSFAQQNVKDSMLNIPMIGLHLSGQLPYGDMMNRFGPSGSAGVPFFYKTKKNFVFGFEFSFFFGAKLKEDILAKLRTMEGTITNSSGNPGRERLNERGWNLYLSFGKLFPVLGPNKNSGILALIGGGYMLHKIYITDIGRNLPQINGDYKLGYDRLTGGPALTQFIGYLYLGNKRFANFYGGFEVYEGFTNGLRGYQYDLMASDNHKRLDILVGLRAGWIIPLYKKVPKDFYYY
jgi:hypothetical protein